MIEPADGYADLLVRKRQPETPEEIAAIGLAALNGEILPLQTRFDICADCYTKGIQAALDALMNGPKTDEPEAPDQNALTDEELAALGLKRDPQQALAKRYLQEK